MANVHHEPIDLKYPYHRAFLQIARQHMKFGMAQFGHSSSFIVNPLFQGDFTHFTFRLQLPPGPFLVISRRFFDLPVHGEDK